MILTNCAACAAPLAHDHKKRCSRCKTRYCNEACQRQHWERGGHEALCRRIKRGGGAEQYHADKGYREAVAVAVEACGAEATCKAFRALQAPVEKARKSYLRAYLRRPRRHWQAAGRGHPGFGREGSPERQRRLDQRRAPSTPEIQRIINTSGLPRMVDPEISAANAWLAHLAGRGLPPDWTYRDLEGHR